MATDDYVAVTGDDWYQRRRQDTEGEFFRKVADQGPRKGQGGSTRQGIYCFTADGKLLAYKNAGQSAEVMRDIFKKGLAEWKKLPEEKRKPGAVDVGKQDKVDAQYSRKPPEKGLILNVHTRILDKTGSGDLCKGTCSSQGADQSARDHMWLTEAEWQGLIPANAKKDDKAALSKAVAERIARFHLVDNTRGEPPSWKRDEVRKCEMTLTVEDASEERITLRLDGSALLATNAKLDKATRGYDAQLLGYISYDVKKKAIDRFDLAALGNHWGEAIYTQGARAGKTPFGVAFRLAKGDQPGDKVPPQFAREVREYLGTGK